MNYFSILKDQRESVNISCLDRSNQVCFFFSIYPVSNIKYNSWSHFAISYSSPQLGSLGGSMVKNLPANARRRRFTPWVGKIPKGRKWQPSPVFLPGKSHGQWSLQGLPFMGSQRTGHDLNDWTITTTIQYHYLYHYL